MTPLEKETWGGYPKNPHSKRRELQVRRKHLSSPFRSEGFPHLEVQISGAFPHLIRFDLIYRQLMLRASPPPPSLPDAVREYAPLVRKLGGSLTSICFRICFPVGFKRNLSLLDILFPGGLSKWKLMFFATTFRLLCKTT